LDIFNEKIKNITRLRYYEQEYERLYSSQKYYRRFFDHGPASFVIIDKYGYVIDVNYSFIRNLAKPGQDKLDYIGKHIFSGEGLFPDKILDICKALLLGKKILQTDIAHTNPFHKNTRRFYSVSGASFTQNEVVEGIVLVYEDITSRIEIENDLNLSKSKLEETNNELNRITESLESAIIDANKMAVEAEIATISKSIFLANMSHEIRTPLNAVVGFTDLMLSTPLSDEQKEYIESIRDSSQTFLGLINDILDYSKIEANKVELENIPFSLDHLLDETLSTTGLRAYEKNVEVVLRINPDVPNKLTGDPVRIKQILVNILGNAVKFTEEGQILIRVETVSTSDSHVKINFSVSDTGIGIPAFKRTRLFEPFSQVSNSTTREFGGTGLGLAISKKLSGFMNGHIDFESPNPESDKGPGSVFNAVLEFGIPEYDANDALIKPYEIAFKSVTFLSGNKTTGNYYRKIFEDHRLSVSEISDPSELEVMISKSCGKPDSESFIFIDDSAGKECVEHFLKNLSNHEDFNKTVVLLLSPFTRLNMTPETLPTNTVTIKKPFRYSHLSKYLVKNEKSGIERNEGSMDVKTDSDQPSSFKILLVEDNKINQKVTIKMLKKMGHTVTVADNGNEAVDFFMRGEHYDVILMDGLMPVMDGFKATEIIRINEKEHPDKGRTPIIALTANAMKGDREKYLKSGMDDYIAKPVKYEDLSLMLSNFMERKKKGDISS
jgi:PAS domain S-box-containing protein